MGNYNMVWGGACVCVYVCVWEREREVYRIGRVILI